MRNKLISILDGRYRDQEMKLYRSIVKYLGGFAERIDLIARFHRTGLPTREHPGLNLPAKPVFSNFFFALLSFPSLTVQTVSFLSSSHPIYTYKARKISKINRIDDAPSIVNFGRGNSNQSYFFLVKICSNFRKIWSTRLCNNYDDVIKKE